MKRKVQLASFFLSVRLPVFLSGYLSVCLTVCFFPFLCLFVCLFPVYLLLCLFIYLSDCLLLCHSFPFSVPFFVSLFFYHILSACSSVRPSIFLSVLSLSHCRSLSPFPSLCRSAFIYVFFRFIFLHRYFCFILFKSKTLIEHVLLIKVCEVSGKNDCNNSPHICVKQQKGIIFSSG